MLESVKKFGRELKRTNDLLGKHVSYKHVFMLGVVQGIGSAIGATIIAGILVALILQFLQQVGKLPYIDRYFGSSAIRNQSEYTE